MSENRGKKACYKYLKPKMMFLNSLCCPTISLLSHNCKSFLEAGNRECFCLKNELNDKIVAESFSDDVFNLIVLSYPTVQNQKGVQLIKKCNPHK